MKTQVLIIGAGPTGLALAAQLSRYGIDYIIIEKTRTITKLTKAIGVHARTLEIFHQMGLAEKAVEQGEIVGQVKLMVNGKTKGGFEISKIGQGFSMYPFLLILDQSNTEKLLLSYIKKHKKKVLWNTELIEFTQQKSGIKAKVKPKNKKPYTISAQYIVGCDGASSFVRQSLKLSFGGSTIPKFFYVADTHLQWKLGHDPILRVCFSKNTFIGFFPMKGKNQFRIVGALPEVPKEDKKIDFAAIEARVKKDGKIPFKTKKVNWFSTYKVHSRAAKTFQKGRAFIAGDAAHIHTPAGAQGMNTGIQDAYNLAWKLALVLKKKSSSKILKTYSTERVKNAKKLLKTTDAIFESMAGPGFFSNILRMYFLPYFSQHIFKSKFIKKRVFPFISQVGIKYPGSALTTYSELKNISAGDRMPFFKTSKGINIYEYIKEPKFHFLSFGHISVPKLKISKNLLDKHHFDQFPKRLFGKTSGFYITLRPDNHILYIGSDAKKAKKSIGKIITLA